MKSKLLHQTLKAYVLFALGVFLLTAPLGYWVIDRLFIEDVDEALLLREEEFRAFSMPGLTEAEIPVWNRMNRDIKIEPPNPAIVRDTIFNSFYYDELADENEPYRVLLAPVTIEGRPYTFLARINLVESEDLILSIGLLFCAMLLLLLVGLYLITKWLSKKLWRPFYAALEQLEQLEVDKNPSPELVETGVVEFDRLNTSVKTLIQKNTAIYNSQREFVENAAHELQTPLAVFKGKLETLMQRQDLTGEQAELLAQLDDAASRLNRLNKNLLLLSKIDNSHFGPAENFLLNEVILRQLDFFAEQAQPKNITIRLELKEKVEVRANLALTEILVSNLFLNSIRYNIPHGQTLVRLGGGALTFSNTGSGQPLSETKLFQRFSKQNPAGKGSGLGLAIIKKITDLHGWPITYAFPESRHTFQVKF